MAQHTFTIDIAAPPETVYDIWVDPERSLEWTEGLTKVTDISGELGRAGTSYRAWFGPTASRVQVVVGERPRRFAWQVRLGPIAAEFDSSFEPSSSGTMMTETVRTTGLISWLWNRVLSTGSYRGSFRGELRAFARICEREARSQG
jgi:polyketide cyclase/dehydrase/lipid transport protein